MNRERKRIAGPENLAILKRYLVEKVPISDLCDQYGLQPSQVYYWQAQLFGRGASRSNQARHRALECSTSPVGSVYAGGDQVNFDECPPKLSTRALV